MAASGAASGTVSAGATAPEGSQGAASTAQAAEAGSLPPAAVANVPDLGSREGSQTLVSSWPALAIDDPSVLLLAEKKQKQESAFAFLRSAEDDGPSYKPHTWKAESDSSPFRLGEVVQGSDDIYIAPVVRPAAASPGAAASK